MMVLLDIGPVVEEVYGSARYLFLYVFTGMVGFILSAFTPFRPHPVLAIGASGAIMGVLGLMIAITTRRGGAASPRLCARGWFPGPLPFSSLDILLRGFDNWGGILEPSSGFLLGKAFADREPRNSSEVKRAYTLGWIAALVLLASFTFMILHYRDPLP